MFSDNRKIIVWFIICFLIIILAKLANLLPSPVTTPAVLGEQKTIKSPGFGHLLPLDKR